MKIALAVAAVFALAVPAQAVTIDNGIVLITQADALAGNVTPGDTAGFPITISVSGSYRLASNLAISTAVDGIDVNAPDVTIDFAGFRMAGSGLGLLGIRGFYRALTVKNGTIRGFTQDAIASTDHSLTVDHMRIVDNPNTRVNGATVTAATPNTLVRNSNLSRNGINTGILCSAFCRVESNIIVGQGNISPGVAITGSGGIVIGNTISGFSIPIITNSQVSIGDNTFVGNTGASVGTILPLNPNQPAPPL